MSFTVTHPEVQESVKRALAEDIGTGPPVDAVVGVVDGGFWDGSVSVSTC